MDQSDMRIVSLRIEETASGAVSCLLLDIMYPGQVPLHRINWSANKSFEYVGNYKILQTAFTKLKIDRHIDVDRMISGRAMDNLEFMQWFKRYFELQVGERSSDYDPTAARSRGKGAVCLRGRPVSQVPKLHRPDQTQPQHQQSLEDMAVQQIVKRTGVQE